MADLGHVADPPKETVGDPGGPAGSPGDLVGPLAVGTDLEDPRAPEHDLLEVPDVVIVQARAEPEPLPERQRDPSRTGGGPDQREARQIQADRPRRRALAEHHVEREVLESRVEHLLDGPRHAVDLVDEEHVALAEVRQDRREVARALQSGAGGGLEPGRHRVRDDLGERGLAEPRRAAEQQVVNGLPSFARRLQEQCELFLHTILPDELSERAGTQGDVELVVFRGHDGCLGQTIIGGLGLVARQVHHVAHRPTCWSASRRRSSTGFPSASKPRSASEASADVRPSCRRATRTSASGPWATSSDAAPSLSRRSRTTRCATFFPTPGTTVSVAASPATTARRIASGRRAERKLSATLGPTPVTPVS